jgi:sugar lactone lactonase YvrE
MSKKLTHAAALCLAAAMSLIACESRNGPTTAPAPAGAPWQLEKFPVFISGFDSPECVALDEKRDMIYVSNIQTKTAGYWEKDEKGFISLMEGEGMLKKLRWKDSTEEYPLSAPKGMCVCEGLLYVADIDRVVTYSLAGEAVKTIEIPGAKMLNDAVAHEGFAYVSDTGTGKIWKLGLPMSEIKGPPSANGLTFDADGRMYCASYEAHEIYQVDPSGVEEPRPLGLAKHFAGLDSIEILADGTMIVSDVKGNRIYSVSADHKSVQSLAEVDAPADVGLDRKRNLLYVPMLYKGQVAIYKLKRN